MGNWIHILDTLRADYQFTNLAVTVRMAPRADSNQRQID